MHFQNRNRTNLRGTPWQWELLLPLRIELFAFSLYILHIWVQNWFWNLKNLNSWYFQNVNITDFRDTLLLWEFLLLKNKLYFTTHYVCYILSSEAYLAVYRKLNLCYFQNGNTSNLWGTMWQWEFFFPFRDRIFLYYSFCILNIWA